MGSSRDWTPGVVPGVFLFALMTAYAPGLLSPALVPRWALLSLIPLALPFLRGPLGWPMAAFVAFLGYAALSLSWTPDPYGGALEVWTLILLAVAIALGAAMGSLRPVYIGAGLGLALNGVLVVAQISGFQGVLQFAPPAGLFMNKNHLAEAAVLVLIGLAAYRLWWLAALVLPAALLTGGRGALAGLAAAAIAWLWQSARPTMDRNGPKWTEINRPPFWSASRAAAVALAGLAAAVLAWSLATGDGTGIEERLIIWRAAASNLSLFGHGAGAFFALLPSHAPAWDFLLTRPAHAHNDALELLYQFGLAAALPIGLALAALRTDGPERYVLIAFMTEACFGFPLHVPTTLALAGLALGQLERRRLVDRDALAAVGMALPAGLGSKPAGGRAYWPRRAGGGAVPA